MSYIEKSTNMMMLTLGADIIASAKVTNPHFRVKYINLISFCFLNKRREATSTNYYVRLMYVN